MVKFIGNWMFASHIWNDAGPTPIAINLREIQKIEQFEKRVKYILKHLNILEGKKTVGDFYGAIKTYRKIKKVCG